MRACLISNVIRAGADLKQAMTLARHTDPRLTAGRYARTRLNDLGAVVDKLPEPTKPDSQPTQIADLLKTGTDSGCTPDVPTPGFSRGGLRIDQETEGSIKDSLDLPKSRKAKGKEGNLGLERAVEEDQGKSPRPDSNRGITVLQTAAASPPNACETSPFSESAYTGCTQGCTCLDDPELARIVQAWATMPKPSRRALLALIENG